MQLSKIIRMKKVQKMTGLSTATIYRRIAAGDFPRQVPLGAGSAVGWYKKEIKKWLADRRSVVAEAA